MGISVPKLEIKYLLQTDFFFFIAQTPERERERENDNIVRLRLYYICFLLEFFQSTREHTRRFLLSQKYLKHNIYWFPTR